MYVFKSAVNRKCGTSDLFLSSKAIDFVQETTYCLSPVVSTSAVLNSIKLKLFAEYELEWQEKLNSDVAMRGINAGGNKLQSYQKF